MRVQPVLVKPGFTICGVAGCPRYDGATGRLLVSLGRLSERQVFATTYQLALEYDKSKVATTWINRSTA